MSERRCTATDEPCADWCGDAPGRIVGIVFDPPMAIARVGRAKEPMDAYEWALDENPHRGVQTRIVPAPSLRPRAAHEGGHGPAILEVHTPEAITFKDREGRIRPIAPFFELWARVQDGDGTVRRVPLTARLLAAQGTGLNQLRFTVQAANRKAQSRTKLASCAAVARVDFDADDYRLHRLDAVSPRTEDQTPLVRPDAPLPLGTIETFLPNEAGWSCHTRLDQIRLRYTPGSGDAFGPPEASVATASPRPPGDFEPAVTQYGNLYPITRPENRILSSDTPWLGLEFDLRQLDVRFFPGLIFEFAGIEPSGPDGTQGVRLVVVDTAGDPVFDRDDPWVAALRTELSGAAGAALGGGQWYLHAVEQYGRKILLYDVDIFQNAAFMIPYEGETCWWIIRGIEADDTPMADLTIALTQRDANGQPTGSPVVLHGKRRRYLDENGVISAVYRAGELTASMCSPWTHDFRDCACQYWASNHPDVVLGPLVGPALEDGTSRDDPAQAVTFREWLRRRSEPGRDVSARTTLEAARAEVYDPYEINLKWEELDFVLQGEETEGTPVPPLAALARPPASIEEAIADLTDNLAPLEFTLALEYLYAFFSLRAPDEVTAEERRTWPELADDLRAVRQFVLAVALSEMTHMRWANQILWMLDQGGAYPEGSSYAPVVRPRAEVPLARPELGSEATRPRALRPATPEVLDEFVAVERPSGDLDTEYAGLVALLRRDAERLPEGLFELAVRIDSDGLQHFQKFRDVVAILTPYRALPALTLRPMALAPADDPAVADALGFLAGIVGALEIAYQAERDGDLARAAAVILASRETMRSLRDEADRLARAGIGVPFFAAWDAAPDG